MRSVMTEDGATDQTSPMLSDSETMVNELVAAHLTRLGLPMTGHEAFEAFLGYAIPDIRDYAAARIPIADDFIQQLQNDITNAMRVATVPIGGAPHAVKSFYARGIPVSVCSNSGREELHVKLKCLELHDLFEGRIISYEDVERPKPHPDMYLRAGLASLAKHGLSTDTESMASHLRRCLVVEDSVAGVKAGVAAGCHVVGLAGSATREALTLAGAHTVIEKMTDLVDLFLP